MTATVLNLNSLWVDSRPRALAQDRLEAATLGRLAGRPVTGQALELGGGRRGTGARLALTRFDVTSVTVVDLYEQSAAASRTALANLGERVTVEVADARDLPYGDASFDAVFAYHVLHHTPNWRDVVEQAARVLRPGGLLLSTEMTARFVDNPLLRAVSLHPDDGDRPTAQTLRSAVESAGLRVLGQRGLLGCWTALAAEQP